MIASPWALFSMCLIGWIWCTFQIYVFHLVFHHKTVAGNVWWCRNVWQGLNIVENSPKPSQYSGNCFGNFCYAYLIFIIFFTWAKFLENKITPKKHVNYDKIHSKLTIFCVITAKYTVNCQFFALNLKKNYTCQKNLHWRRRRQLSGMSNKLQK